MPHPVRSLRQSKKYGFGSNFTPDYTDVESYFARIKRAVVKKEIYTAAQFHGPVRLMLDLDPTSYVGIRTGTLRFIRLLASYFIMSPALNKSEVSEALAVADKRNEIVALEDPTKKSQL